MKLILCFSLILANLEVFSQAPQKVISLHELIQKAESDHPNLKAKNYLLEASKKTVAVSKNTGLPSLDASYQLNYATNNNITGMAYPTFIIPISGPPSSSNSYSGVFGSATSLLMNWQPITFGQREAQIAQSEAGVVYANAEASNEILQHKIKVANTYLDILTANELLKVFTENIQHSESLFSITQILVQAGLKPGVDTVLFAAEISKAKLEWLNESKNKEQHIIHLQQLLASGESLIIADSSYFHKLPVNYTVTDTVIHPLFSLYTSTVELDKTKRSTLSKSTMPIMGVWGTTYARGSGTQYDGSTKTLDGIGFQRVNYGLGVQISMPLLQTLKIKPQLAQQDLQIKADQEKLHEMGLQLNSQQQTAESMIRYALSSVKENDLLVNAALYSYTTIVSRYAAGLTNYSEVVQAQYNLAKSKADQKTAYMAVWKALLYKAAATGDVNLFLKQVN